MYCMYKCLYINVNIMAYFDLQPMRHGVFGAGETKIAWGKASRLWYRLGEGSLALLICSSLLEHQDEAAVSVCFSLPLH